MSQTTDSGIEQRLLDASLILLVAYNALFLADIALDSMAHNPASKAMAFIDARRGWVTLFEAVAAFSLFIDLVVRHYEGGLRIFGVASGAGLIFKAFAFYLNSSYLEDPGLNRPTGIRSRFLQSIGRAFQAVNRSRVHRINSYWVRPSAPLLRDP